MAGSRPATDSDSRIAISACAGAASTCSIVSQPTITRRARAERPARPLGSTIETMSAGGSSASSASEAASKPSRIDAASARIAGCGNDFAANSVTIPGARNARRLASIRARSNTRLGRSHRASARVTAAGRSALTHRTWHMAYVPGMGDDERVLVMRLEGGKANAMTSEVLDTIERLVDDFERAPACAGVLTGYERFFSAGLAITKLVDLDRPAMRMFIERFARSMTRVLACEKPIVAALNGHAIAGGCVLALMCDWRVMADDPTLKIGLNETQLGIGLPAVVIEPLRAQVPPTSLVPIALEGKLYDPAAALALGLVHELAPAAELAARAHAKASALAALPTEGTAQVKRALRAPVLDAIMKASAVETERWLDSWFSDAGRERVRAAVAQLGA
ncbi:MAG: enoyl-CoA hydratase/isomerase family protein [Kofleriaceae bacterium]